MIVGPNNKAHKGVKLIEIWQVYPIRVKKDKYVIASAIYFIL